MKRQKALPAMLLWLAAVLALISLPAAVQAAGRPVLPVYVEESHAGAFYHLVETLPPGEPHVLILFDAHSDASAIPKSDDIRRIIREEGGEARSKRLERWRHEGLIQCFNWLEPLMPSPVAEVIWVPAVKLEEAERARLETEAREFLDAHEETLPRKAGPLGSRYRVMDIEGLRKECAAWKDHKKAVASIDLDFFAALPDANLPEVLAQVMDVVLDLRGLRSLGFAISSPYLRNEEQSQRLLFAALEASFRIANAEVSLEPFAVTGPDRSLMARLLERSGKRLPSWELSRSSTALRSLLLRQWRTESVRYRRDDVETCLAGWAADPFLPQLQVVGGERRADGVWCLEAGGKGGLRLAETAVGARVRWFALRMKKDCYHLGDMDFGFASGAPRWLFQERILLAEGPALRELALDRLAPVLHPELGCGTVEVFAEVEYDGHTRLTARQQLCVRAAGTKGARAIWSEQFVLPYVFDSRLLARDFLSGPETGLGADCANFIVHGLRQQGWRLPWGNPRDLTPWLKQAEAFAPDETALVYLGNHLAAVWEDRHPLGSLNDDDLCVHQLESYPELLSFKELREGRPAARLMTLKSPARPVRILFAGDVMLGRKVAVGHPGPGLGPFADLRSWLDGADAVIGNLECVISASGGVEKAAGRSSPILLVAPPRAADWLNEAGFKAVSVANNHAEDLGASGREGTANHLLQAGVPPVKAGEPVRLKLQGLRLSLLAWDDSAEPEDDSLRNLIREERKMADCVVVLPHWGTEHLPRPTDRQRMLARRWLDAGAHWIIGSGPHCVQPLWQNGGGGVAFSLGNAVFDGPGPDSGWSRGAWLEMTLDAETQRTIRARLVPTVCDEQGRARLADAPAEE